MRETASKIVKYAFFILAGIGILVFNTALMGYIPWMVAAVMAVYGLLGILEWLRMPPKERHWLELIDDTVLLVMAGLMLIVRDDFGKCCVIWAVWSILREGAEVSEVLERYGSRTVVIVDLAESLIVVILSVLLVIDPEEHAHSHVILLGIEMLLEAFFPMADEWMLSRQKKA